MHVCVCVCEHARACVCQCYTAFVRRIFDTSQICKSSFAQLSFASWFGLRIFLYYANFMHFVSGDSCAKGAEGGAPSLSVWALTQLASFLLRTCYWILDFDIIYLMIFDWQLGINISDKPTTKRNGKKNQRQEKKYNKEVRGKMQRWFAYFLTSYCRSVLHWILSPGISFSFYLPCVVSLFLSIYLRLLISYLPFYLLLCIDILSNWRPWTVNTLNTVYIQHCISPKTKLTICMHACKVKMRGYNYC